MQSSRLVKVIFYLFIILFNQISLNAEIIKFTECKFIKKPLLEAIHTVINNTLKENNGKTQPFNEKEALASENSKYERIERIFDTETKILTYKSKVKNEEEEETRSNFEVRDENTFVIVNVREGGVPSYNKNSKKIENKDFKIYYEVYFYYLSEGIVEVFDYSATKKELFYRQKCKSNYTSKGSSGSNSSSSGTAFFINSKGYLLTNNHVVDGCKLQQVKYNNKDYEAKIIATDKTLDLALMKIDARPKNYLNFSESSPEKLQKVYVAGYPFGKGLSDDLKISSGIVSSVKGFEDNSNEFQLDAAINPGNSGGPIVDDTGELIGIAVAGLAKDKSEGINFGIKSLSAVAFLKTNNIDPETSFMTFGMNNKKLLQLLEESTVYTYCN